MPPQGLTPEFERLIADKIRTLFGPSSCVETIQPLAGDASSRRYYRIRLSGPATPKSAVIMQLPPGTALPLSSEELAIFKEPLKELPFLNIHRFLQRIGVRVPDLYGQWEKDRILILQDLGDIALWDCVQGLSPPEVAAWYRKAIDELLILQIRGTKAWDESCIAFQQRFDFRLYTWEFEHFIEHGLQKKPGTDVSEAAIEQLRSVFAGVARRLEAETPCLNHRDYHSWNLLIHNQQLAVIDFQDALLAPPQYDLASLLNDRETDRVISPELEGELIQYYLDGIEGFGDVKANQEEFFQVYLLSAVQRDLKVVGRFYYLDRVRGKPGYLKFIPAILRRLKRNLLRSPQLECIVPILAEHYEEMQ